MGSVAYALTFVAILVGALLLELVNTEPHYVIVTGALFVMAGLFFLAGVQWHIAERFGRAGRDRPKANDRPDPKDEE